MSETNTFPASTVLGYPRIGPQRELKQALEAYWRGAADRAALAETGRRLRAQTWHRLAELGLEGLPSNTFSEYDQVLDTAMLLDAVPERFRDQPDPYFAMARGSAEVAPLRMTKWFDTNYHYIVPEIGPDTWFRLVADKPLAEVREARALGHQTRPVLVGPVTFLLLSQAAPGGTAGGSAGFAPLDRLPDVLDVYAELLAVLAAEGVDWVQLDEPCLVNHDPEAFRRAYTSLGDRPDRPRLLVASYFGQIGEALPALGGTAVEAVALDLTHGVPANTDALAGKTIVAGVVSGRSVWRTDRDTALALLGALPGRVTVSTSCSLLHVPYTLAGETGLPDGLAFAEEKVAEVVELAGSERRHGSAVTRVARSPATGPFPDGRRSPYPVRAAAQRALGLPELPVTTIGSFPQTGQLRAARAAVAAGRLSTESYEHQVAAEIERVVRLQERLGIDVLVHGEPERNDMVQYFAEHLDGFAVTRNGWVQSYGSRCTRPPILHGDVRRRGPITVHWATYAQSLTDRPVKGMLTGPVTIVAWSFVRPDRPLRDVTFQVADAIRDEVRDLEAAGVRIIQVDEPALRELLPLRPEAQPEYLAWAVAAYRRATSGAADGTQIHTHLCYSNAAEVLAAIDALDADVTSIESARSGLVVTEFARGLGPGVYDIHSPRVPDVDEVLGRLGRALAHVPRERLWVNPDCGLKTRTYPEVEAALTSLVKAAAAVR